MIKITTLIENKQGNHKGLKAEHGLSFFIETDTGHPVIFDTGQGPNFLENAAQLNIDLHQLEAVVLSHSHYDHTGGLPYLLRKVKPSALYVPESFLGPKYRKEGVHFEYLGNSFLSEEIERLKLNSLEVEEAAIEIQPGLYIITGFESTNDFERVEEPFFIFDNNRWVKDSFKDELAMAAVTSKGLVIISGCAHAGIINIIRRAVGLLGRKEVRAVIGGTHLIGAGGERLFKTAAALLELEVEHVGVSHCTGEAAGRYLKDVLGDRVFFNTTGTTVVFD